MSLSLSHIADNVCPPFARPVLDRVKGSPIARRLASGAFWSVIGNGLARGITFVAMILVARILGKEAFGEFGLVRSTATTFVTFSAFGMGLTATKYIAELLHSDRERVGRIIGLSYLFTFISSFVVSVLFWLAVPWLCETLNAPHLIGMMRLGAVLLFFATFMTAQTGVMQGFQDFRGLALATFLGGMTMLPIYIAGAYWWGLWGAVVGAVLAAGLNVAINSMLIYRNTKRHCIRYDFTQAFRERSVLGRFSLPAVLCMVTYSVSFWACQMMLGAQKDGATQLGLFYAALTIFGIIMSIPMMFSPVYMATLSDLIGKSDKRLFRKTVFVSMGTNLSIGLLFALPCLCFPSWIMTACFGAEFRDGAGTLALLSATAVLYVVGNVIDQVMISLGWLWFHWSYCVMGALATCAIAYLTMETWGAFGLALAIFAGFVIRIIFVTGRLTLRSGLLSLHK